MSANGAQRKDELIRARVTPEFHQAVRKAADKVGLTISDFAREAIIQRIDQLQSEANDGRC